MPENKPINSDSSERIKELQAALEQSSSHNGTLLLAFLLFQFYLFLIIVQTTDLQLLLPESRVVLPLLNIELPLLGFYIVAPALVVILHFNLLIQLLQHTRKLREWNESGSRLVLIPPFLLNYGIVFQKGTPNHFLVQVLSWLALFFSPIALLLFFQLRFDDYHNWKITLWQTGLICLDLFVLFTHWQRIIRPELSDEQYDDFSNLLSFYSKEDSFKKNLGKSWRKLNFLFGPYSWLKTSLVGLFYLTLGFLVTIYFVLPITTGSDYKFSFLLRIRYYLYETSWTTLSLSVLITSLILSFNYNVMFSLLTNQERKIHPSHTFLFGLSLLIAIGSFGIVYLVTHDWFDHYHFYLPRIEVQEETLVKAPPSDAVIQGYISRGNNVHDAWVDQAVGLNLKKRDLRYANLYKSKVWNTDMREANLKGAYLYEIEFYGSNDLEFSVLDGADLTYAKLNGVNLNFAELNGACLFSAQLNQAKLSAYLNGTRLDNAQLNGAILTGAVLNGANLRGADLNGANLEHAELNGAILEGTELRGVDFSEAQLAGTNMKGAKLNGACFKSTEIRGSEVNSETIIEGMLFERDTERPDWKKLNEYATDIPEKVVLVKPIIGKYKKRQVTFPREDYLNRIENAYEAYTSTRIASTFRDFKNDFSKFLDERKKLACKNSYVAEGMLKQILLQRRIGFKSDFEKDKVEMIQMRRAIIDTMLQSCPDTLEIIRKRDREVQLIIDEIVSEIRKEQAQGPAKSSAILQTKSLTAKQK